MSTLSLKAVVVHNSVTSFMMETNLRKGGLVHQVPCSKSREKLQEFCLYRQRKLKILNVEDERSLNGQKEILVNFRMMQRYIYIYVYIYVYLYEKNIIDFQGTISYTLVVNVYYIYIGTQLR